jgi:hypothetical protein
VLVQGPSSPLNTPGGICATERGHGQVTALAGITAAVGTIAHRRAGRRILKIIAAATGVGLLTGFCGVEGWFVIVPALVPVIAVAGYSLIRSLPGLV